MPVLLFYRMLVMAEIFTAEFLFILRLRRRNLFALRFAACVVAGEALAGVLPLYYNAFYTSFTFLLLACITVPMLKFCCDENFTNIVFCVIAAYTIQHFSYGVADIFLTCVQQGSSALFGMYGSDVLDITSFDLTTLLVVLLYILAYFVSYTMMYFLFIRRIERGENFAIKSVSIMAIVGAGLVVDIFFNSVIVYYGNSENIVNSLMNIVYENVCCFFLLYIQFGLVKRGELETELNLTQLLLREQEKQYNLTKENIELINFKCHDLKHQIRTIGKGIGLPNETVKEIEGAISIYDAKVRTDNEVLDIILTEKNLKCAVNGISLTCVADGRCLEFMHKTDIYTLFGNALDNAIEAVLRLDRDRRNVGVIVRSVGEMVTITVYNNFDGKIVIDGDGFPVTNKSDTGFHGIGLKSIRKIAEKYKGTSSVRVDGDRFELNVLLSKKLA